jgi:hypothetical protein
LLENDTLPVGWTTKEFTFTKAEVDSWNLDSLPLRLFQTSGTTGRRALISWVELEILDLPADDGLPPSFLMLL